MRYSLEQTRISRMKGTCCTAVNFLFILLFAATISDFCSIHAFSLTTATTKRRTTTGLKAAIQSPPGGVTIEDPPPPQPKPQTPSFANRGKVNEIDFCIAPSDVSLSRSYDNVIRNQPQQQEEQEQPRIQSLTRALNNASNRAVRRILLSRSWPSAEALNVSLRQVLASGNANKNDSNADDASKSTESTTTTTIQTQSQSLEEEEDKLKCPVPRPILNIIMRQSRASRERGEDNDLTQLTTTLADDDTDTGATQKRPRRRTDEEWVEMQMAAFRESYGQLPGYPFADAYLECILSLATTGVESDRVSEVLAGGVYDESYRRLISVIKSVGAVFEVVPPSETDHDDNNIDDSCNESVSRKQQPRMKIASKLLDQDICLSMLDKIAIENEKRIAASGGTVAGAGISVSAPLTKKEEIQVTNDLDLNLDVKRNGEVIDEDANDNESMVIKDVAVDDDVNSENRVDADVNVTVVAVDDKESTAKGDVVTTTKSKKKNDPTGIRKIISLFKMKKKEEESSQEEEEVQDDSDESVSTLIQEQDKDEIELVLETDATDNKDANEKEEEEEQTKIKPEDLGAVLLSAEEPTMTRQLNVLSNIVKRALLFGGDQELLVLSETLEADKPAFVRRWYPNTPSSSSNNNNDDDKDLAKESRPGVQYFNCLVQLLQNCYNNGTIANLDPPLPLTSNYANSYERLTALLVELGSGYIKPSIDAGAFISVKPKTPTEEFLRFSQLEVALRRNIRNRRTGSNESDNEDDTINHPNDLVGTWQVRDEIGGKVIGTTTVVLRPGGDVSVDPPLRGLRWRLDPGPTHLDTCTFQVLSDDDGAVLQYRGFMDRGARLESRFSGRSIRIRGAVSFKMRDGEGGGGSTKKILQEESSLARDVLPATAETGTTRFVMTKVFDLNDG